LFPQSGGIALVSGDIWSGAIIPTGGLQLKLARNAPSDVYVGFRHANPSDTSLFSGYLSGAVTITSGGSLSSGGLADGIELSPGDTYFVPRVRLGSGIQDVKVAVPAAASGGRLYWDFF
jgi:hypothetical protein